MVPAIDVSHLSFSYRNTIVLEDVTFSVQENDYLGIIGPNGSGKTTLLKVMLGFLQPIQGSVSLFGIPPEAARTLLAYVPQALQYDRLFPIDAMEVVLSGRLSRTPWHGRYSRDDKEAASDALDRVGIASCSHKAFGSLSGGQRQRALIARALVAEPKILFLDEPTANVDSEAEADIYKILNGLRKQMTIVMVTHNLRAVIDHVDRVLCVQRTAFLLKPSEVCEHFTIGLYHEPIRP